MNKLRFALQLIQLLIPTVKAVEESFPPGSGKAKLGVITDSVAAATASGLDIAEGVSATDAQRITVGAVGAIVTGMNITGQFKKSTSPAG